jgi:2-hydroxy-6-oxonona-2,4-dienedioate hydrolase
LDASTPPQQAVSLAEAAAQWSGTRRVAVGPWRMRFREAGEGPPIVLVHGLGVSADYWYRNGPALAAAGHRVLAPDLPGFGRTAGPSGGLSISRQAGALLRWAETVGVGPAIYVGHSLSCQTILELAAYRPERVRGLVLAAPTGDPEGHRLLRQAWGLLRDVPRESLRLAVEVGAAYLRAGPVRVWRTWRKGAEEDAFRLIDRVRAPGLVVVGTRDPVVRPAFAEALARALPSGRLVWIEGGAHAVIFDPAPGFNRAVVEFAASF